MTSLSKPIIHLILNKNRSYSALSESPTARFTNCHGQLFFNCKDNLKTS